MPPFPPSWNICRPLSSYSCCITHNCVSLSLTFWYSVGCLWNTQFLIPPDETLFLIADIARNLPPINATRWDCFFVKPLSEGSRYKNVVAVPICCTVYILLFLYTSPLSPRSYCISTHVFYHRHPSWSTFIFLRLCHHHPHHSAYPLSTIVNVYL